ncbi:hypothetical protein PG996_004055 [Apiospora saccharicola]|uniref:Uncharacterized protein n=1 Tax=Apiospora saccharicola TaxID=335842 RepID=A0ABR1W5Z0_9PEZI
MATQRSTYPAVSWKVYALPQPIERRFISKGGYAFTLLLPCSQRFSLEPASFDAGGRVTSSTGSSQILQRPLFKRPKKSRTRRRRQTPGSTFANTDPHETVYSGLEQPRSRGL